MIFIVRVLLVCSISIPFHNKVNTLKSAQRLLIWADNRSKVPNVRRLQDLIGSRSTVEPYHFGFARQPFVSTTLEWWTREPSSRKPSRSILTVRREPEFENSGRVFNITFRYFLVFFFWRRPFFIFASRWMINSSVRFRSILIGACFILM